MSAAMDRVLPQRKLRRVAPVGLAAMACIVALAVAAYALHSPKRVMRIPVDQLTIGTVTRQVFHDYVPVRGSVVPHDVIYVDAQEGGVVDSLLVQAGDSLSKGQPLLQFNNTQLQLDVIEREARLIEEINNLRGTETTLEQTHTDNNKALGTIDYNITRLGRQLRRYEALVEKRSGALSHDEVDKVRDELEYTRKQRALVTRTNEQQELIRRKRLPEIGDALAKLREDLRITRAKLETLTVRAPAAGRLTTFDLKVGESCVPGQRLAEITPNTGFKVSADVDEYYLGRVAKGQVAIIDYHSHDLNLSVNRVYPQVKSGKFSIDLNFIDGPPAEIFPGETLQGRLEVGAARKAVVAPAGSYLDDTGGRWIFRLAPHSDYADRRSINIGQRNADEVEILSGLQPGDRVVISDYRSLEHIERIAIEH